MEDVLPPGGVRGIDPVLCRTGWGRCLWQKPSIWALADGCMVCGEGVACSGGEAPPVQGAVAAVEVVEEAGDGAGSGLVVVGSEVGEVSMSLERRTVSQKSSPWTTSTN